LKSRYCNEHKRVIALPGVTSVLAFERLSLRVYDRSVFDHFNREFHHGRENIMTKNMGTTDRIVRTLLGVAVIVLIILGKISGITAIILCILAVVFLVTSSISFCPLYVPLKLSTTKKQ
jgi:hypothetical protein